MLILISPAKTMKEERIHTPKQCPVFSDEAAMILKQLKTYDMEALAKLMKVNANIARTTAERFANMKFDMQGIAALDAYDGIQFKSMQLTQLQDEEREYLNQHLRILSGFYGLVHPDDAIYPYRLEMQTPISIAHFDNLYKFWKDQIAQELSNELSHHEEAFFINLASKEYERAVRPYIVKEQWIDVQFYTQENGKLVTRSTQVKKARGMMVYYMSKYQVMHLQEVKQFQEDGYCFHPHLSTERNLVFVKGAL